MPILALCPKAVFQLLFSKSQCQLQRLMSMCILPKQRFVFQHVRKLQRGLTAGINRALQVHGIRREEPSAPPKIKADTLHQHMALPQSLPLVFPPKQPQERPKISALPHPSVQSSVAQEPLPELAVSSTRKADAETNPFFDENGSLKSVRYLLEEEGVVYHKTDQHLPEVFATEELGHINWPSLSSTNSVHDFLPVRCFAEAHSAGAA